MKGAGAFEWMRQEAEAIGIASAAAARPKLLRFRLKTPCTHYQGITGRTYPVRDGVVEVDPEDAAPLRRAGNPLAEEA